MYKLYYAPGTCALASHIALEEAGADYSAERLDFKANQQQSPDYLKINAKGRVPALVTDKGIITETPAILAYIAQTFPKAKLAPTRRSLCVRAGAVLQQLSLRHRACRACAQGPRLSLGDGGILLRRHEAHGAEEHGRRFDLIEKGMLKGPWVMGEQYTVCDPYLYTIALWLEGDSVDLKTLPKVADHMKRMADRPAVKKVMGEQQAKAA